MAKFEGGAIGTLGIKGSFLTELATQTASSGAAQALGQVWQGSGQSFYGKAGQALGGALAGSAVNIALNSVFKGSVPGPAGFTLDSGQNILASVVTPYVTNNFSEGINQNIQKSLQNAGPFGPALSGFATGLVSRVSQNITDTIFGATTSNGPNLIAYPGGGGPGEAPADYGGSAYTLTDIVFSLQPANQGPQAFGDAQAVDDPKSATTTATNQVAGNAGTAQTATGAAANTIKAEKMAVGSSGKTDYDKAILQFMSKGTPTSEAEIAKLNPAQLTALNDTLNATDGQGLEPLPVAGYFGSWSFITAPEDVSWDVANNAQRVDIFGTNNPPVVAGSRGMRDLTLGNALVEGFMRGLTIEGKVAALENLLKYSLNATDGFVSVPVYQVWANEKSYGGPEAYYIIKDVKVKEAMRDLKGNATRAYVDISLMQVPAYQVNSGRDQASATTAGVKSGLISATETRNSQQAAANAANAVNAANPGSATPAGRTGANAPKPQPATQPVNARLPAVPSAFSPPP